MPPCDKKFVGHSLLVKKKPYNKLLKIKTTTKTGNNQKLSRKVPEESVEAV